MWLPAIHAILLSPLCCLQWIFSSILFPFSFRLLFCLLFWLPTTLLSMHWNMVCGALSILPININKNRFCCTQFEGKVCTHGKSERKGKTKRQSEESGWECAIKKRKKLSLWEICSILIQTKLHTHSVFIYGNWYLWPESVCASECASKQVSSQQAQGKMGAKSRHQ